MKRKFLLILSVMFCCLTMTAFAACGDDGDDSVVAGTPGEATIVAFLPKTLSPYFNIEVTYYDAQGNAKSFTVRDGESSDDLPSYSKESILQLSLFSGVTLNESKCIVRTIKFALPANKKVACKYRLVRTIEEPKAVPSDNKVYAPFAVATGKRPNSEVLPILNSQVIGSMTITSLEEFKAFLLQYDGKEAETYIMID